MKTDLTHKLFQIQTNISSGLTKVCSFSLFLWAAGEGHQPNAHRVPSVADEQRQVRVLHQRGLHLLPGPGRGHRRPAYTNQRPRA